VRIRRIGTVRRARACAVVALGSMIAGGCGSRTGLLWLAESVASSSASTTASTSAATSGSASVTSSGPATASSGSASSSVILSTTASSSSSTQVDSGVDAGDGGCEGGSCTCPPADPMSGSCDTLGAACSYPWDSCLCERGGCGPGSCCPITCAQARFPCGPIGDGCGNLISSCRVCPSGQTCGSQGTCEPARDAGCVPICPASACGMSDDGCGGKVYCGECGWSCAAGTTGDAGGPEVAILFSGLAASGDLSDTWSWIGNEWSELAATGPHARDGAVVGSLFGGLILFGGNQVTPTGDVALGDTWAWNGGAWTELDVAGPPARSIAVMAPLNGELVLFGGYGAGGTNLTDTWTWNGARWTELAVTGPPSGAGAVMAPFQGKLVLYGGFLEAQLSDTWTWDGAKWSELPVSGPDLAVGPSMAPLGGKLVLLGSVLDVTFTSQTWTWDGSAWTNLGVPGPPARQWATLTPVNGVLVLFGGIDPTSECEPRGTCDPSDVLADTWTWDGASWTKLAVSGPPARAQAVAGAMSF